MRHPASIRTERLLGLLVVVACLSCSQESSGDGSERVSLGLSYSVGETLRYLYTAEGTVTYPDSTIGEEQARERYDRRIEIDEVATEVAPNGNYLLAWTYHLPPRAEPASDGAGNQTVTIRLEITPQGRIVEVADVETAKPLFGDMDFRTYLEQTQPVFPERPLMVGDSWTQHVRVLSPRAEPVVTTSNYVLEEVREMDGRSIAVIAFDGNVYLPRHGSWEEEDVRSSEERIRVRGRLYFDHELGLTRKVETTAKAEIIRTTGEGADARRSTLDIDQTSQLELLNP